MSHATKPKPSPTKSTPENQDEVGLPLTPPRDVPAEMSENARLVLARRYLIKDEKGEPTEEPADMFWRVARTIAGIEKTEYGASSEEVYERAVEFYRMMVTGEWEPNSPTLMNAGRPLGQLSACFVLPVDDEIQNGKDGIYDTLGAMARTHKSGGGTGFSFSRLRPANDVVKSTMGVASGPVSFMRLYDSSTDVVRQGGTRRGANMGILRVDHPDIRDFITCKRDTSQITNFNISVAITDEFVTAAREGRSYDLVNPRTGEVTGQEDAREIFDAIVEEAWRTGEPGIFFIDRANEFNPVPALGEYEATNPCVTGDTQVATPQGPRRFDALAEAGEDVEVFAFDRESGAIKRRLMRAPRLTRSDVPVLRIRFESGLEVRATPDHHLIRPNGAKVKAEDLAPGDTVAAFEGAPEGAPHRVSSVEDAGHADVYNGTVDELHTYVIADPNREGAGIISANCGEQVLLPYDVCNLGSLNVGLFVREDIPDDRPWRERVDWEGMRKVIHLSTRFLDNVIDANRYPLPEIHDLAHRIRRIGNGVMGWADLLIRLGIPYDSEEGVEAAREMASFFSEEVLRASEDLAEERGAFPEWESSIWGPEETCARDENGRRIRPERRLRNCNATTVAPTGTISIFADCSGGIEPIFAVAFRRRQADAEMVDVNKDFVRRARAEGWHSDELMERVADEGHIHFEEIPEDVQRVFRTSHDITPEWHVRMQAAWQEHVDASISKTVNFPREATQEDVRQIYELAHELGCKGVTVYRDGSRGQQVLSTGKTEEAAQEKEKADALETENEELKGRVQKLEADLEKARLEAADVKRTRQMRKRPNTLTGKTREITSPHGDMFVTINQDENEEPFEVFAILGKAGGSMMASVEAIARLISLALRSGIPVEEVHRQLRGISSDQAQGFGPNKVLSVPDAIAQAIEQHMRELEGVQEELPLEASTSDMGPSRNGHERVRSQEFYDPRKEDTDPKICEECGSNAVAFEEGCLKCRACGNAACG